MKVALIYGGPSAEYEVSVNSAAAIRKNLDPKKYEVTDVHITKAGKWILDDGDPMTEDEALSSLQTVDIAFLAVHGTFGEDGRLQELLAQHHIKFTGSDAIASALAMDKIWAGQAFADAGLRVPLTLEATTASEAKVQSKDLTLPFVVKPVSQGSSVGVTIVRELDQLEPAIKLALSHDTRIVLQEFISGREVSCGVLTKDNGDLWAMPPTELIPADADFFDYHAKYTPGATNEITPPDMDKAIIEKIQQLAVKAHQVLGCQGYSRTDMFVADDDVYLIETNTLPGMTETSILPQQAVVAGLTFAELLEYIIRA